MMKFNIEPEPGREKQRKLGKLGIEPPLLQNNSTLPGTCISLLEALQITNIKHLPHKPTLDRLIQHPPGHTRPTDPHRIQPAPQMRRLDVTLLSICQQSNPEQRPFDPLINRQRRHILPNPNHLCVLPMTERFYQSNAHTPFEGYFVLGAVEGGCT